jgi:phosphoribosyl 1,2-cyclic phosphodiesterase
MLLFRSLASGSSGNAYLLRTGKVTLLFECGLTGPKLRQYLAEEGVLFRDLAAIFVSHEHRDHCLSVREVSLESTAPVCANAEVLKAIGVHDLNSSHVTEVGRPTLWGDVEITTFSVSHDAICPVGYLIAVGGRRIVLATDLGDESPALGEAVRLADLVVLEANHDLGMLHNGNYPPHLRRRVGGALGHLSNGQSAAILAKYVKRDAIDVWLAHLSKENNTPKLAMQTVSKDLRASGRGDVIPRVLARDKPSLRWFGTPTPRQLSLFDTIDKG